MPIPSLLALHFYHAFWAGFDWLYPPVCAGCGVSGDRWCKKCAASVRMWEPPICPVCGRSQNHAGLCHNCQEHRPHFSAMRAWGVFEGPLRLAIHKLKYHRDITLGDVLAKPLIPMVAELGWHVDLVMPVPLSNGRQRERGYNQSAFLARPIAISQGIPILTHCLKRMRETRSQVGLDAFERKQNVDGAFWADARIVTGKKVLIVDDVTTTGATLDACAAALCEAGAQNVYGLTLARAALD